MHSLAIAPPGVYLDSVSRIEGILHRSFEDHHDRRCPNRLIEAGQYALLGRGKRLRGAMLLEACRAVGGQPDLVLSAAAGIEYGHLASLVHDDLMDQDELRRGKQTIWKKYGTDYAILTGDLFIFQAYLCVARCRQVLDTARVAWALESLSQACIGLCLGQALEVQLAENCFVRKEEYMEVIRCKTGSLFRATVECGAILGGGTDMQVAALGEYGELLGMAFQITDDLLSYTTRDGALGKPTKSDLKNRRITLPIIYALERANSTDRQTLRGIFGNGWIGEDLEVTHQRVIDILQRTGARERAEQDALCHHHRALECLHLLPSSEGRESLVALAQMIVEKRQ